MLINIIGMGTIGTAIYDSLEKQIKDKNLTEIAIEGSEIDSKKRKTLTKGNYRVKKKPSQNADIYIIAVYTTEQVIAVLKDLKSIWEDKYEGVPLVSIESTIEPDRLDEVAGFNEDLFLLLFPHRFNPNDPEHKVFNLDRLMGAFDEESLQRGLDFYTTFMDKDLIHIYDTEIVALAKPLENAYRFAEIVISQEIYLLCKEKGLDFDEVREACNTKFNIDIKESRKGVGGVCLPKDMGIIKEYSECNSLFWTYLQLHNNAYKLYKEHENDENNQLLY